MLNFLASGQMNRQAEYSVKKWTLQFDLLHITVLVLNQSPISVVFAIVRFPFAQKISTIRRPSV